MRGPSFALLLGGMSLFASMVHGSQRKKEVRRSNVEGMIAQLRERARASVPERPAPHDEESPRPLTEPDAGAPCAMPGLVVRREMGNLGVTSFQVALAGIVLDALGPSWTYFDDWQHMAEFLRPDRHLMQHEADSFRQRCKLKVTLNPTEQEDLELTPFNITDGSWVRTIREKVCGELAPWNRGKEGAALAAAAGADQPCVVVKIQNHWEHAAFFYRYRRFLQAHVFRSPEDLRQEYVLNRGKQAVREEDFVSAKAQGAVADLLVYLRLGDKSNAGDTTLTYDSGYYDFVLKEIRHRHRTCWIVTQTVEEPRARAMAKTYACELVSHPKQYTDWTLMLHAPGTLVMAASTFVYFQAVIGVAKEVHYPAVGFFHDKHNVCMRERNKASHFGQIRLPFDDKKMVYHDIYSRQFFLTYDELAAESAALPCDTILDQHVCDLKSNKYQFGAESRYCYRSYNATSVQAQEAARATAKRKGHNAVKRFREAPRPARSPPARIVPPWPVRGGR